MLSYCAGNTSLLPPWTQNGISVCFLETVTSSVLLSIMILGGGAQLLVYWMWAIRLEEKFQPQAKGFQIQVTLSLLIIVQYIIRIALEAHSAGHLHGYNELSTIFYILTWMICLSLLWTERSKTLMSYRGRGHGLVLLVFWTFALVNENLAFISWNSPQWWWSLGTKDQKVSFGLWLCRYVLIFILFVIGFRAPALPKKEYRLLVNEDLNQESAVPLLEENEGQSSAWSGFWHKTKLIWPSVWPKGHYMLQGRVIICLMILISGRVANVYVPVLYKDIVNELTKDSEDGASIFPWHLICVYVAIKFLQGGGFGGLGLLSNVRSFLWIKVQQYTTKSIMVHLFGHLHSLSLHWHLNRKTGEVLRIMDRGTTSINSILSYILFNIAPTIADILIAIVFFITSFNAWFGLIVFIAMAAYVVATIAITEWRTKYRREMNLKDNEMKQKAVDSLLNFETVKYYGNEDFEVDRYDVAITAYQSYFLKKKTIFILFQVGDYVLFSTYIMQLYSPLNFFGTYYRMIQQAFIDMENMIDLMEAKQDVCDNPDAKTLVLSKGKVEFRNVSFHYSAKRSILKNISFSVNPGETVALVGPSGAGKSTIIRLLFRFYDLQGGQILIDGQNITTLSQSSLRKVIGVVPQDTVLFNNDIRYNIRYGRVQSSDQEVEDAAAAADIHHKIEHFPEGYATVVGERGLKLSGGEKQRVAIARTVLKAPEIVLLDEATSALDTRTERNIQASLNNVCNNRTTIVVAHRLSTIINANTILVLQEGAIIERGRHEELLQLGGIYASMWQSQLQSDEEVDNQVDAEVDESNKKDN
ncbi:ATP-binding cassette sub-family B member 6, mitochondrial-like [Anneissia japonica]|uniref:ATP-binding cassette sub-family B member 6, mitochondrial-like n=1 Tax=Anneissia japonica TaxID=1529436 RepID=UPI001425768A|nr:ATP-binding cassette sub-family B member 6, mitochondrial-like [Anneissia japonica]